MTGSLESLDLILSVIIDDEPQCEFASSRHIGDCVGHVVSLWRQPCKGFRVLGCVSASAHRRRFQEEGGTCMGCDKPAVECWREIPV